MSADEPELSTVTLPLRLVSLLNKREHHMAAANRAASHRNAVRIAVRTLPLARAMRLGERAGLQLLVTITRVAPRELDDDNLTASAKHVRDGVADALGLASDRDQRVLWRVQQRRGEPREYAAEVRIERHQAEVRP